MKVLIDSNIICEDFLLSGSMFRTFFDGLSKAGHTLYVPRVVIDEVKNKYIERLREYQTKVNNNATKFHRLAEIDLSVKITDVSVETAAREYGQMLNHKFEEAKAVIRDYPTVSHETLVRRDLSRNRPFSKTGKGYRDSLIWVNVMDIAEEEGDQIAFLTADKDFSDSKSSLHSDLIADLHARGLESNSIVLFDCLDQFIKVHVYPALEVLENVRRQLSSGEYPGLDLRDVILDRALDLMGPVTLEPDDIGFRPEFEDPTLSLLEDIWDVEVLDVRKLPSGELLIRIEAEAECEFDVFVFKPNFFAMSEGETPFMWDYDWNRHYVAASATKQVHILLYLTYDTDSGEVTSMDMESICEA